MRRADDGHDDTRVWGGEAARKKEGKKRHRRRDLNKTERVKHEQGKAPSHSHSLTNHTEMHAHHGHLPEANRVDACRRSRTRVLFHIRWLCVGCAILACVCLLYSLFECRMHDDVITAQSDQLDLHVVCRQRMYE